MPFGEEVEPGDGKDAEESPKEGILSGGYPDAVDNSTLASFPPVRSQGSLGSCASFSSVYYAGTHMLGTARGFNNRNNADNTTKLSPKWAYNMVNDGQNAGSWFTAVFDLLVKHGAPSWAAFPYSDANPPTSYREWSTDAALWRGAVRYRFSQHGKVSNLSTSTGLDQLKSLLVNGFMLLYATDIYGWQWTTIANDPSTTADDAYVGQPVCPVARADSSGHAMTVVGYNDTLWVDLNKNGVVDAGERGALRVVNSWGTGWKHNGFAWLAYDALKPTSAVAGGDNVSRVPAWWNREAYYLTARAAYMPSLLAQFTLSHAARSELRVRLAVSATNTATPASYWTAAALQNQGGPYAFNGGSVAVSGSFVFDLTDLAVSGSRRYYVEVTDNASGRPASLSDFRLTDAAGQVIATAASGVPGAAGASTILAYATCAVNAPIITNSGSASATAGTPFTFTIRATGSPTSYGAAGLPPGLTINTASGVISGTPTQAGTYNVSLSANNSAGTGGAR